MEVLGLHSNMVIFKCWWIDKCRCNRWVYIPIWLYSNGRTADNADGWGKFTFQYGYIQIQTVLIFLTAQKCVYIPIWLYSNFASRNLRCCHLQFTFQYGYIQIFFFCNIFRNRLLFTFQYGYIQMNGQLYLPNTSVHVYIPIWLYSNQESSGHVCIRYTFTFQYGYIQIQMRA